MKQADVLDLAKKTINRFRLCNSCLGRLFREIEKDSSNYEKGELLLNLLKSNKNIKPNTCWLCEGLVSEINHFTNLIFNTLKDYEFNTFLIGSKIDDDIINRQKEIDEFLNKENTESIKTELNREIGKILESRLNKNVDFLNPDIMAVIDTAYDVVNLQIKSLFIYGRYKKLKRGIPQTKWYCKLCNGIGCRACNYKGKLYEESVEEYVSIEALKLTGGTDESFHGSGREDIDVLMIGNGRPFVLEIKNPKIRNFDLQLYKNLTNKNAKEIVEIDNLKISNEQEIVRIKNSKFNKIYRITIECEKCLNKEKLKEVALLLRDNTIEQFTPSRVSHRRAKKIRERKIYNCDIESIEGNIAKIIVETESGTYVKELISGDNGRTKPNLSEMLEVPCIVKELEVIEIKGE